MRYAVQVKAGTEPDAAMIFRGRLGRDHNSARSFRGLHPIATRKQAFNGREREPRRFPTDLWKMRTSRVRAEASRTDAKPERPQSARITRSSASRHGDNARGNTTRSRWREAAKNVRRGRALITPMAGINLATMFNSPVRPHAHGAGNGAFDQDPGARSAAARIN